MGSPTVTAAKPQVPMENKSHKILSTIKNILSLKKKEKKEAKGKKDEVKVKKEEIKPEIKKEVRDIKNANEAAVANILDRFKNLDIENQEVQPPKIEEQKVQEDELPSFDFKYVEDDRKRHSSEDSGYADKEEQETIDAFNNLKIDGDKEIKDLEKDNKEDVEKDKKKYNVLVARGPIRNVPERNERDVPYAGRPGYRQINTQALCGGEFIDNTDAERNHFQLPTVPDVPTLLLGQAVPPLPFAQAVPTVPSISDLPALSTTPAVSIAQNSAIDTLDDILDVINKDNQLYSPNYKSFETNSPDDVQKKIQILQGLQDNSVDMVASNSDNFNVFGNSREESFFFDTLLDTANVYCQPSTYNPTLQFVPSPNLPSSEDSLMNNPTIETHNNDAIYNNESILTPPESENIPSPETQTFYSPNCQTRGNLSPDRSSPMNCYDYETYRELSHTEELSPVSLTSVDLEVSRQRNNSVTSLKSGMSLKNFKDLMKKIGAKFSMMECCQVDRKTCRETFDDHMKNLSDTHRHNVCFAVAQLDMSFAKSLLLNIIEKLRRSSDDEDYNIVLFVLISQRVLACQPNSFIDEFGLEILKAVVLRCPSRPVLTRFTVNFIYNALKHANLDDTKECVFDEVDLLGDNLVISCARAGDEYALVLAEITRMCSLGGKVVPPLFRVHHFNKDGYTALHVACIVHSAASPRLHTIHVLLEHSGADLWKGDLKGNDTALHLAVNSPNCDLHVILMIFKQIDRKMWKKLAHYHNRSSVSPLEYARAATKSTTRQNYPQEVQDFLKKCRN